jgi:hypothetical protein
MWVKDGRTKIPVKFVNSRLRTGNVLMSRDLAASHSLGTNTYSSICRESTSAVSRSFAIIPAEEEAGLIMSRLVREYLEHRPIRATGAVRSMLARP